MSVARADSTGEGGETSKSESTSKGLKEANREGGRDMGTRGGDPVREETSRMRVLLPSDFDSICDAIIFLAELALVSSWGWCVCPSDCSLKEPTNVVGLERVSSWGHRRGPSACLSKRVARIAGLARVAS